jgi:hypothetical protein
MFLRWAAAASVLVALAGCADGTPSASPTTASAPVSSTPTAQTPTAGTPSSSTPSPSATTAATTPAATNPTGDRFAGVQLVRSGGIAGSTETTTIRPDGSWQRTSDKGSGGSGKLTPADLSKLTKLAADPRIKTESSRKTPTRGRCNDTYNYLLIVG